ncbi:MAG TPA: DEAD/DEAH box helicase [Thermoanaerobaculia bacterium]|nr:DEAD/DEAH box helicase [Thermoanaerobaculia bacterium]
MDAPSHLELHRAGVGLVPPGQPGPETAIYVARVPGSGSPLRSCNCAASRARTCPHLRALDRAVAELKLDSAGRSWEAHFSGTLWYRLARLLYEGNAQPSAEVRVGRRPDDARAPALRITSRSGEELARYFDASPARLRFLERIGKVGEAAGGFDRAALLGRLALFQLEAGERELAKHGVKTRRQAWEESFWHRLAYHCVREFAGEDGTFHPAIDAASGRFTLTFRRGGQPALEITVPRREVRSVLNLLAGAFPQQQDLAIHPVPLRSIFHVSQETRFDLSEVLVRPAIQVIQASGEERFLRPEEVEPFRYGNLVYLKELGILAELERPGHERKFRAPAQMKLKRSQVPSFLAEYAEAWEEGAVVLDEELRRRKIFRDFEAVEIAGEARDRSWYWLAINYGLGNQSISLAELLRAKRDGLPFLEIAEGWIDLNAPAFSHLDRLAEGGPGEPGEGGSLERAAGAEGPARPTAGARGPTRPPAGSGLADPVCLTASELLGLQAAVGRPLGLAGGAAAALGCLLELRPARPLVPLAGMKTTLRPYQQAGLEWLRFLWENRLGGLLCDDMGLGKTHQAMALLVSLAEQHGVMPPFLVVCPTSVISHWRDKIRDHAPGLRALIHHGAQRVLPPRLRPGDVVVTSYGILLRDLSLLAGTAFSVAIFDEVQNLKNRDTKAYQAAVQLRTEIKLGLTGTPIENSLADLKALFDLVLPGYLGSDSAFAERYSALAPAAEFGRPEAPAGEAWPMESRSGMAAMPLLLTVPSVPSSTGTAGGLTAYTGSLSGSLIGCVGSLPGAGGRPPAAHRVDELRRIISPFTLRRLKQEVLDELPEKIEDVRTCLLSADQVKLYRDATGSRGAELARAIEAAVGPLPYIHIFALLQLLKQICDHPALALRRLDEAESFTSGKWDLYRELLSECLESGQKVVVFTQFLGMITLMQRHLDGLEIDHVTLTGASGGSGRRGALISRFNSDPGCRVFLGSLKAGGTGIDLAAASTVIHYDRWWNAAREDQATDRVHRIGQRRAVQVFKLVTEGTLEEKISSIIERKRRLMDSVVAHDDPSLAKIFTRSELLELLSGG